jgi:hypothetical protein
MRPDKEETRDLQQIGSKLTLIDKHQDGNGRLCIHAIAEGAAESREYSVGDFTGDAGLTEINEAVANLSWRIIEKTVKGPKR